jgi:hypothetical protein
LLELSAAQLSLIFKSKSLQVDAYFCCHAMNLAFNTRDGIADSAVDALALWLSR